MYSWFDLLCTAQDVSVGNDGAVGKVDGKLVRDRRLIRLLLLCIENPYSEIHKKKCKFSRLAAYFSIQFDCLIHCQSCPTWYVDERGSPYPEAITKQDYLKQTDNCRCRFVYNWGSMSMIV